MRRITRNQTKKEEQLSKMEEDDEETNDGNETEEDEDIYEENEMSEYEEDEESEDSDEINEDQTSEEEEENRKRTRNRNKAIKTKSERRNKKTTRNLQYKEMKKLFLKQRKILENSDKDNFNFYVIDKFIKFKIEKESKIGLIKEIQQIEGKNVKNTKIGWKFHVITNSNSKKYRNVDIEDILDEKLTEEDYSIFCDDLKKEIMSSKDAKLKIKDFEKIETYEPSESEIEMMKKYRKEVLDIDEDDDFVSKKNKHTFKNERFDDSSEENEVERKMEIEIPTDFILNDKIIFELEECHKRCDEMEKFYMRRGDHSKEIKEICSEFFDHFEIPQNNLVFEQTIVVPKLSDGRDKLSKEDLKKYL